MKKYLLLGIILLCSGYTSVYAADDIASLQTLQSAATANGNGTDLRVRGYATASVQVTISGTATVTFQTTADGGTYSSLACSPSSGTAASATTTATGLYQCPVAGMNFLRAAISGCSGCTVTVTGQATTSPVSSGGGGGGSVGTVGSTAPTSATEIAGTNGANLTVPYVLTTAPDSTDPGLVVRNINPNLAADDSTLSTAKVPVLIGTVSAADPTFTAGRQDPISLTTTGYARAQLPGGTASNSGTATGISAPTANYVYSLNLCGGAATWSACAASGVVDAANNAAAPANVEVIGIETATQGTTQPTAATAGNVRRPVGSTDGALYTRNGGPVTWACSLNAVGTTLTQCQAAPGAGLKLYVTGWIAQSSTATAGLHTLSYGTGANCGTGNTALLFASTAALMAAPANTAPPTVVNLQVPIVAAANNAVCVLGVVTNTTNITVMGYTAP